MRIATLGIICAIGAAALPLPAMAQDEPDAAAEESAESAPARTRQRTEVTPYIEAAQVLTHELEPGSDTVTYTTVAAGVDASVVGRNSAGTNGNVTRLWMPGGVTFTFTGMEVLFPDRSRFHGVGIVPDVEVVPTAEDLAEGRDPELLKAIELLGSGG